MAWRYILAKVHFTGRWQQCSLFVVSPCLSRKFRHSVFFFFYFLSPPSQDRGSATLSFDCGPFRFTFFRYVSAVPLRICFSNVSLNCSCRESAKRPRNDERTTIIDRNYRPPYGRLAKTARHSVHIAAGPFHCARIIVLIKRRRSILLLSTKWLRLCRRLTSPRTVCVHFIYPRYRSSVYVFNTISFLVQSRTIDISRERQNDRSNNQDVRFAEPQIPRSRHSKSSRRSSRFTHLNTVYRFCRLFLTFYWLLCLSLLLIVHHTGTQRVHRCTSERRSCSTAVDILWSCLEQWNQTLRYR